MAPKVEVREETGDWQAASCEVVGVGRKGERWREKGRGKRRERSKKNL